MVDVNRIGLQLFADGGTAGGSAPGGDGAEKGNGLSGDFTADMKRYFGVTPRSDAGNETQADAQNGEIEQEADDAGSATGEAADDAASSGQQDDETEYQMLRTKHKARLQADMQKSFNERFKQFKEIETRLQKELDSYRDTTAALRDKYGLGDDATPQELLENIKADNSNFAKQAMANGVSTEAYRDGFFQKQEEKAAQAQKQAEEQAAQQQQQAQQWQRAKQETYSRWRNESAELQKNFPQFDLAKEIRDNERFKAMLIGGASVQEAFYGSNFDKISSGLVAAATQRSAKKTAQAIAANRARPSEGGQMSGTGIKTGHVDVNSLTDKQVLDILQQVAKGARITF